MAKNKTIHNLYGVLWRHMFMMASQAATCMPSLNLLCNMGQRSGQVHQSFYQGRLTTAPRLVECM